VGVGAAVVLPGLAVDFAVLLADVGAVACIGAVTVAAAWQDTEYAAGLDAAAPGLVTTSTASPDAGSAGGVIASGATVFLPGVVKVTVLAAEFCPSPSAQ
jgi:hypothetical protein